MRDMGDGQEQSEAVGRIFVLESPNALDLLNGTGETLALSGKCRHFGYEVASFTIRDKFELNQTLMYVSSLGWSKELDETPIFLHISAHGNSTGLAFGAEDVPWEELGLLVENLFQKVHDYNDENGVPPIVLVISACGTNKQTLTRYFAKRYSDCSFFHPPKYLFMFTAETTNWSDAVQAWSTFYSKAFKIVQTKDDKTKIVDLIDRVKALKNVQLRCYRWKRARKKYQLYPKKAASD